MPKSATEMYINTTAPNEITVDVEAGDYWGFGRMAVKASARELGGPDGYDPPRAASLGMVDALESLGLSYATDSEYPGERFYLRGSVSSVRESILNWKVNPTQKVRFPYVRPVPLEDRVEQLEPNASIGKIGALLLESYAVFSRTHSVIQHVDHGCKMPWRATEVERQYLDRLRGITGRYECIPGQFETSPEEAFEELMKIPTRYERYEAERKIQSLKQSVSFLESKGFTIIAPSTVVEE